MSNPAVSAVERFVIVDRILPLLRACCRQPDQSLGSEEHAAGGILGYVGGGQGLEDSRCMSLGI